MGEVCFAWSSCITEPGGGGKNDDDVRARSHESLAASNIDMAIYSAYSRHRQFFPPFMCHVADCNITVLATVTSWQAYLGVRQYMYVET